jgi:hypothetical protein
MPTTIAGKPAAEEGHKATDTTSTHQRDHGSGRPIWQARIKWPHKQLAEENPTTTMSLRTYRDVPKDNRTEHSSFSAEADREWTRDWNAPTL